MDVPDRDVPDRVAVTGEAADLVRRLTEAHGPVWMSTSQFAYWKHTHLTIDVVPGRGAGFSLEAPEGVRFLIRSRILSDEEYAALG